MSVFERLIYANNLRGYCLVFVDHSVRDCLTWLGSSPTERSISVSDEWEVGAELLGDYGETVQTSWTVDCGVRGRVVSGTDSSNVLITW